MPLRAQADFSSISEHRGSVYTPLKLSALDGLSVLGSACLLPKDICARYLWWYDSVLSSSKPGPSPGLTSCRPQPVPSLREVPDAQGWECPWLRPCLDGSWLPEPALTSLGKFCFSWPQGDSALCCMLRYLVFFHEIKIQSRSCPDQLSVSEVKD